MHYTSSEMVFLITAICSGICSIIAAVKANQSKVIGEDNSHKLTDVKASAEKNAEIAAVNNEIAVRSHSKLGTIQNLADGNLSDIKSELEKTTRKIQYLERIITNLLDQLPPGAMEKAIVRVYRREEDADKRAEVMEKSDDISL